MNNTTKILENVVKHNRVPHGVVLESKHPDLIDKYTALLCKWAVCTGDNKPCNSTDLCPQCRKVSSGNHPDIYTAQVSGKTEIVNVEEIRKICNDTYIKPNEANIKVYILPNADKMQHQAQNAFLKVLEEPPQNILFILCCTNAGQLLGTIRSRVTIYNLDIDGISDDSQVAEAIERAEKIIMALTKSKGYDLLCAIGELGNNRAIAKAVVEQLNILISNAVKCKITGTQCSNVQQKLVDNVETINLMNMIHILDTATLRLKSNINMNLFTAWLCAELRRQK